MNHNFDQGRHHWRTTILLCDCVKVNILKGYYVWRTVIVDLLSLYWASISRTKNHKLPGAWTCMRCDGNKYSYFPYMKLSIGRMKSRKTYQDSTFEAPCDRVLWAIRKMAWTLNCGKDFTVCFLNLGGHKFVYFESTSTDHVTTH